MINTKIRGNWIIDMVLNEIERIDKILHTMNMDNINNLSISEDAKYELWNKLWDRLEFTLSLLKNETGIELYFQIKKGEKGNIIYLSKEKMTSKNCSEKGFTIKKIRQNSLDILNNNNNK